MGSDGKERQRDSRAGKVFDILERMESAGQTDYVWFRNGRLFGRAKEEEPKIEVQPSGSNSFKPICTRKRKGI